MMREELLKQEGRMGAEINERFPRKVSQASPVTNVGTTGEEGPGPKVGSLGVHGVPVSLHCQNQKGTVRCAVW
jgi:hypothetical protein